MTQITSNNHKSPRFFSCFRWTSNRHSRRSRTSGLMSEAPWPFGFPLTPVEEASRLMWVGWPQRMATGTSNWLTYMEVEFCWYVMELLWNLGSSKNLDLLTCYNSVERGFGGTIPLGIWPSVDFVETILRKILSSRAKMKMMKLPNFHGKSSGIGLSGIGIRTGLGTRRITPGRRTLTRKNAKVGSRIGGWNGNIGGGGARCEDHVLVLRPADLAEKCWKWIGVLGARSKFAYQPFLSRFGVVAIVISIYHAASWLDMIGS